jgi:hypothetical protein
MPSPKTEPPPTPQKQNTREPSRKTEHAWKQNTRKTINRTVEGKGERGEEKKMRKRTNKMKNGLWGRRNGEIWGRMVVD